MNRLNFRVILLLFFALTMAWVALLVSFAAYQWDKHRAVTEPAIYYGLEIPKCNKELWVRIKDRCKDE